MTLLLVVMLRIYINFVDIIFYLQRTSGDGIKHFQTDPTEINVEAGINEGSLMVNTEGDLIGYINITGEFLGFSELSFKLDFQKDNIEKVVETSRVVVKVSFTSSIASCQILKKTFVNNRKKILR